MNFLVASELGTTKANGEVASAIRDSSDSASRCAAAEKKGTPIVTEGARCCLSTVHHGCDADWVVEAVESGKLPTAAKFFLSGSSAGADDDAADAGDSKKGGDGDGDDDMEDDDDSSSKKKSKVCFAMPSVGKHLMLVGQKPKAKAKAKAKPKAKGKGTKRKKAEDDEDVEEDEEEDVEDDAPPPKKVKTSSKKAAGKKAKVSTALKCRLLKLTDSRAHAQDDDDADDDDDAGASSSAAAPAAPKKMTTEIVKGRAPVDKFCPVAAKCHVYEDGNASLINA